MARGTCWVCYEQKGMKMKNGRKVPNCVKKVQKAYLGRAIRQPTETNTEFEIRHEYHTPFEGPQKAYEGKFIDVELNGKRYSNASKKNYYKGMI